MDQMRAIVSLPDSCGTNPGWDDWSWSTETPATSLMSVSLQMYPEFFPFVLHCHLLSVPNMHDAQWVTPSFIFKNISGRTPSFASLSMYLDCMWDNFSCHDLNSCCKVWSFSKEKMNHLYLTESVIDILAKYVRCILGWNRYTSLRWFWIMAWLVVSILKYNAARWSHWKCLYYVVVRTT